MTNDNWIEAQEMEDMPDVDMDKVEIWGNSVICYIVVERTRDDGTKFATIEAYSDFCGDDGHGSYELGAGGRIVGAVPAPMETKKWSGFGEGAIDDIADVGCEITEGHRINFKEELVKTRRHRGVDIYTGEKVVTSSPLCQIHRSRTQRSPLWSI